MINPSHIARFEESLKSEKPTDALHRLAIALRAEGLSQLDMYLLFERFQILTPKGTDDDPITDNMDYIWGGPWAKGNALFPEEITSDRLTQHTGKKTEERIHEIESKENGA